MSTPVPSPFSSKATAPPQGWWSKLVRRPDTAGATAEIERRLAKHGLALPANSVAEVLGAHRAVGRAAKEVAASLWRKAYRELADDNLVTDEEIAYLSKLQHLLGLSERDIEQVRAEVAGHLYQAALKEALQDGQITAKEQSGLDRIAAGLRLTPSDRDAVSREPIAQAMQRVFNEITEDRRVSEAEIQRLERLSNALGVKPSLGEGQWKDLDRFSLLWRIENESLPVIAAGINLQRGEECHCSFEARWLELRTRTVRTYRSGPVASIRIVKGLHYRIGSYKTERVTAEELQQIDTGTVYITNKRMIFDGRLKNTSIRHSAVIALEAYKDGLGIEKATGRSPILGTTGDAEIMTAIYTEALNRAT